MSSVRTTAIATLNSSWFWDGETVMWYREGTSWRYIHSTPLTSR